MTNKEYNKFCFPKEYTLQDSQKFVSKYMSPTTNNSGLLIYHKIGSGKTCAGVRIGEVWKHLRRIIIVTPASLKDNFKDELRTKCAHNEYLTDNERQKIDKLNPSDLEYKEIMKKSEKRIEKYYDIYSYNKFIDLIKNKEINLSKKVLIIDEIQNLISENGSWYKIISETIKNAPKNLRLILLSATPMFDKPNELALTMNLLNLPKKIPTGIKFDNLFIDKQNNKLKNENLFQEYIKGFVSFYAGAPSYTFPKATIKYIKCQMSKFQYNAYKTIINLEDFQDQDQMTNNFYIGTRMISNIVFPNETLNKSGYDMLTQKEIIKNLQKYSCKFYEVIQKIRKQSGKKFVYSNFTGYGGILSFVKILKAYGYSDYTENGIGKKRFALWTGDESLEYKRRIKKIFNNKNNLNGQYLQIIIGSSSIKEGVSLTNCRYAYILDGYWNNSRMEQIMGRVNRYCSHKDLLPEQRKVTIYIFLAGVEKEGVISIDEYMKKLAEKKDKTIKQFEKLIIESSIDCELNYERTIDSVNYDIKCLK